MLAKSLMQKNRIDEYSATGKYPKRVDSISSLVFSATSSLADISSDRLFDDDRIWIAVSSSNMLPFLVNQKIINFLLLDQDDWLFWYLV